MSSVPDLLFVSRYPGFPRRLCFSASRCSGVRRVHHGVSVLRGLSLLTSWAYDFYPNVSRGNICRGSLNSCVQAFPVSRHPFDLLSQCFDVAVAWIYLSAYSLCIVLLFQPLCRAFFGRFGDVLRETATGSNSYSDDVVASLPSCACELKRTCSCPLSFCRLHNAHATVPLNSQQILLPKTNSPPATSTKHIMTAAACCPPALHAWAGLQAPALQADDASKVPKRGTQHQCEA